MRFSTNDYDHVVCLVDGKPCRLEVLVFRDGEPEPIGLLSAFDTDEGWADQLQPDRTMKRITGKITAYFEVQLSPSGQV